MTINLNFQAAPVERIPTQSPQQETAGMLEVGNAVIGVASQWLKLRDEREFSKAQIRVKEALSEKAKQREGKFYYDAEELIGTGWSGQAYEKAQDGTQITKQIPAWEAEPYIQRRESLEILKNAAAGITNWNQRQKFIAAGKSDIEDRFQIGLQASLSEMKQHMVFETVEALAELQRIGDHEEALDLVEQSSVLSQDEKTEYRKSIRQDREIYDVRSITVVPDWGAEEFLLAEEQINYLGDSENYDGPLELKQRIALINELQTRQNLESKKAQGRKVDEDISWIMRINEEIDNKNPEIDTAFLLKAVNDGLIKGTRALTMANKVRKNYEDDLKKVEAKNELLTKMALTGGYQITEESRAIVDDIFKNNLNKLYSDAAVSGREVTPEEYIGVVVSTAKKFNVVPNGVLGYLEGLERGNAQELKNAAIIYRELQAIAPETVEDLNRAGLDTVANVVAGMNAGMNDADALRNAIMIRDARPAERELIEETYRSWTRSTNMQPSKLDQTLLDLINKDPRWDDGLWYTVDDVELQRVVGDMTQHNIPIDMRLDFQDLFKSYLGSSGAVPSIAKQKAWEAFNTRWGVSKVNVSDGEDNFIDGEPIVTPYPIRPVGGDNAIVDAKIRNHINVNYSHLLEKGEKLRLDGNWTTLVTGGDGKTPLRVIYAVDGEGNVREIARYVYDYDEVEKTWLETQGAKREKEIEEKARKDLESYKSLEERKERLKRGEGLEAL
jgi:hypothetical protein